MNRPKRLSAAFIRTVNVPGRYGDGRGGHGLSLLVKPRSTGGFSKSWSQRLLIARKPVNIGLGAYPIINLAEAREQALHNRRVVAQGGDPRDKPRSVPNFIEAVDSVIEIHAKVWKNGGKSERQWRASLNTYVLPELGDRPVNQIQPRDVMRVLLPIWSTKPETARRVRQRIGAVMKWAVAQGYRTDNPAGDAIGAALPSNSAPQRHFRALPHAEVGKALKKVRDSGAHAATALCFELMTLCAVRSGEARHAHWEEIDLKRATWTIPAHRMKAKRTHRVPLSKQAVHVLTEAQRLTDGSGLIFPSPTDRILSDSTLSKLCRELKLGCVPHGLRSSFRDYCAELSDAPREVCELALAHVNSDRVEAAYRRSDLFERRRELMQQWADYVAPAST